MAVRETLELDVRRALADVGRLEGDISDLKKPIVLPLDIKGNAVGEIKEIDQRLEDIETGVKEVNRELAEMEVAAGNVVVDFSKLASELNVSEQEAQDLARGILEARNASERTAEAAKDVARQLGLSEDDARKFASEIGKGRTQMDQLDDSTRRTGRAVDGLRSGFGRLVLAAGAFIGIRELGRFATESVKAFSNLEESTSKANVVFGDFAKTVLDFTALAPTQLGSTQAAALEAASSIGNLFLSIGLGQEAAAGMSIELLQLGTDLASFNNISVDEALEKLRSGLVGETEPLRTLGVLLSETAVSAKGAELGLGSLTGQLSEAEKVQARYAIILEQTVTAQGDFERTSDGIANATRTAVALFEEFKTRVGEALAPAFSELLKLVPQIIDGFEGMVPGIVAAAQALTEFFVPRPGQADFMDFANFLLDLPRGFAEVGTTVKALGLGLATIGKSFGNALTGDFASAIRTFQEGLAKGAELAQDSLENVNIQGFVQDLRAGIQPATALANALHRVGKEGKIDPAFVRNLIQIGGISLADATATVAALTARAHELGLEADDLFNLRVALAQLASVGESSEADRFLARTAIANKELADTAAPAAAAMEDIASAAGLAELSFVELRTSTDPVLQTFRDMLSPAQNLQLTLDALGEDVTIAASLFTNTLKPSIIDAGEAMKDFNDDGRVSLDEFIKGLQETFTATLNFRNNMTEILQEPAGGAELFNFLLTLPQEAAAILAQQAVTEGRIAETAAALLGDPEALAEQFGNIVREAIQLSRRDPALADQFILGELALIDDVKLRQQLEEQFTAGIAASKVDIGNAIEDAFRQEDAANRAAGFTSDAYDLEIIRRVGELDGERDIGDMIEEFFTQEDAATAGAAQTVEEYRRAVINALAAQRFGFASDIQDEMQRILGASNLNIEVDVTPVAVGGSFTGSSGGVTVINNVYNPTVTDLATSTAQMNQSTSAVANQINQVPQ